MPKIYAPWYLGYRTTQGRITIFGHDKDGNDGVPIMILDKDTNPAHAEYMINAVNEKAKREGAGAQ